MKTVQLPVADMAVDPTPLNPQDAGWADTFAVSVDGATLTVQRIDDADSGWWQPLELLAMAPNPPGIVIRQCGALATAVESSTASAHS